MPLLGLGFMCFTSFFNLLNLVECLSSIMKGPGGMSQNHEGRLCLVAEMEQF